jgi:hypothetical protein
LQKRETIFRNNQVVPFLKSLKCYSESIQQTSIRGSADIAVCINGRSVRLEIKASEKAKRAPLQIYKLEEHAKSGGISLVVYPENWQDVKNILLKLKGVDL